MVKEMKINGSECYNCGRGFYEKKQTGYTAKEFLSRFTDQEKLDIIAERNNDPYIELLLLKLKTTDNAILVDSKDVINGVNYLVSVGLIEQYRADEILADL